MEVPGPVEPGLRREARHVDDERVAFPPRDGVAHVGFGRIGLDLVQVNGALGARELEDHHDLGRALDDLKLVRHVHRARNARQEALDFRIAVQPVVEVLLLPLRRPRLVRDLVALDHAEVGGYPADRAQRNDRRRQHRHVLVHAGLGHHRTRGVGLEVPVRAVVGLPDAAEVGLPVRLRRHLRSLGAVVCRRFAHRQHQPADDHGGNDRDHRLSQTIAHEKLPSKRASYCLSTSMSMSATARTVRPQPEMCHR